MKTLCDARLLSSFYVLQFYLRIGSILLAAGAKVFARPLLGILISCDPAD
jgi:hypothetical protein